MKLFLASEAKHPESMGKLSDYIGGFKDKKLAYIPTAANGESKYEGWKEAGSWNLVKTLETKLTLVQLEEYKNSSVVNILKNQDIIWFAGGMPGYLMYWIIRCELDKYLPEILENTLYVGSSAGSMITAKNLDYSEWYPDEPERGASNIPGLGLVDFDFWPHYEESHDEIIKQNYKGKKMYLVKNGDVILVDGDKVQILGEERIIAN